jgi:LacI family transcriptional regulator
MNRRFREFNVFIALAKGQATRGYGQRLLDGIIDFAREQGNWRFHFLGGYGATTDHTAQLLSCDGMLGLPENQLQKQVERAGLAGVIAAQRDDSPLGQVFPDDAAIGRMAYRYFRELGFNRLAFAGYGEPLFSARRRDAFVSMARGEGLGDVPVRQVVFDVAAMGQWLRELAFPCGLFCANALVARHAAISCEQADIRVPQDVAILGCDDDVHICELTWPPLSAIDHGARQIGYRSARMLDRLMRGRTVSPRQEVVPPVRVVERQSTNTLAMEDEDVADALQFIRSSACEGIDVSDVLAHVAVPRRRLERAFRRFVNRGIGEEITRVKLRRARELLVESDLPTPDIAARSGFSSASKLSAVFRRELNLTPTAYRRSRRH